MRRAPKSFPSPREPCKSYWTACGASVAYTGYRLVTDVRLGFEVSKGRVMVVAFHPQKLRDRFHFAETKLRTSDSVIIEKVDIIRTEAIERGIVVEIGISSAS